MLLIPLHQNATRKKAPIIQRWDKDNLLPPLIADDYLRKSHAIAIIDKISCSIFRLASFHK